MKKIVSLLLFSLATNVALCQVSNLDSFYNYDEKYISLAEQELLNTVKELIHFRHNDKLFEWSEFEVLRDQLLNQIAKKTIKQYKKDSNIPNTYDYFYKNDSLFRDVNNDIDHLSLNKENYVVAISTTHKKISTLNKGLQQKYSKGHLNAICQQTGNVEILNYNSTYDSLYYDTKTNKFFDEINTWIAQGQYVANYAMPQSLTLYAVMLKEHETKIKNQREASLIEFNIAKLYLKRRVPEYRTKAIEHFELCLSRYTNYADSVDSTFSNILTYAHALVDKGYFTDDAPNYFEILKGLSKSKNISYGSMGDTINFRKNKKYDEFVLNVLALAINNRDSLAVSIGGLYSTVCNILGHYLKNKEDTNSLKDAISCFNASLLLSAESNYKFDAENLYECIINIALIQAKLGNTTESLKIIDNGIAIAQLQENSIQVALLNIYKGNAYYRLKEYNKAIVYTKRGIALANQSNALPTELEEMHLNGYGLLMEIYEKLENKQLADYYRKEYVFIYKNYLDELFQMVSIENELKVSTIMDVLDTLNNQVDGLEIRKSQLDEELTAAIYAKRKVYIGSFIVLIVILSVLIWVHRIRIKQKERQLHLEKENLTTFAKAKIHNIRNNYTSFLSLVDNGQFDKVKEYAESSAYFFSKSLDVTNDDYWTVYLELQLMQAFYDAERVIYKDVEITTDINDIDIRYTLCLPEMFTTILQNSMEHGFKTLNEPCKFLIRVWKDGKLVYFEFTDNGIKGNTDEYLLRENSGLNILKKRVENKLTIAKLNTEIDDCLLINGGEDNQGTHILIKLPYETPD